MQAQNVIYQNERFILTPNQVTDGKFTTKALSNTEILSDFSSGAGQGMTNELIIKFSINGKDNEQGFGIDHKTFVIPDGNSYFNTPIFSFGNIDYQPTNTPKKELMPKNINVNIRLDMRHVIEAFRQQGYYTLYNGEVIKKEDFKGVYVAGNLEPLTWDFDNLEKRKDLLMQDVDNDGIYELNIIFNDKPEKIENSWASSIDLEDLPKFESNMLLANALYNMSLEEMLKNIRPDQTFMAGAKWEGVWTRDISYSILLSLAMLKPDIAKASLLKKTKNGFIIQDTGSGGSYPISSDRTTWALAAYEIYLVTGDKEWLKQAYAIIQKTAEADLQNLVDADTHLFYGESSFLDWREQSYARWQDCKDIYKSMCLGTNAVHYQTYHILSQMATDLNDNKNSKKYIDIAQKIKQAINKNLWITSKGYYGQFLYGRNSMTLSPKPETLGEALCILFDIADETQVKQILSNSPTLEVGTPCFYPQIPNIPPYHNDAVWLFVDAYRTWAAAKNKHTKAVEHGIATIYRQSSLFLTNKENMVASTGNFFGTEINSDRQLWSVAGNLALVYRIFFGMKFTENQLVFEPFIPKSYQDIRQLSRFKYRNAELTIKVHGFGNGIKKFTLDGKTLQKASIDATLTGKHTIEIFLNEQETEGTKINLVKNRYAPETPLLSWNNTKNILQWNKIENTLEYEILLNGKSIAKTKDTVFNIVQSNQFSEYQVKAIDAQGFESFASEPVEINPLGVQYVDLKETLINTKQYQNFEFEVKVEEAGMYLIDFEYANGNGTINTDNKCALRSLYIGSEKIGTIVFAQRGINNWKSGYSNSIKAKLKRGKNIFNLALKDWNENMNGEINEAKLFKLRLQKIQK
jgi:glycogen debranching enzyme